MQVVLYDPASPYQYHARWAAQFKAADPQDRKILPVKGQSAEAVLEEIRAGAKAAAGGTLIFAVGHGGTDTKLQDPAMGWVQLAPRNILNLGRRWTNGMYLDVFYDFFRNPSVNSGRTDMEQDTADWDEVDTYDKPEGKEFLKKKFKVNPQLISGYKKEQQKKKQTAIMRRGRWLNYKKVGYALQQNGVDLVLFFTCNMGNSTQFVKKISIDWGTKVRAYRKYVWFGSNGKRVRAFLDGDPGDDLSKTDQETDVPQNPSYFYTAGPAPGTEEANQRFWDIALGRN